ncbi:24980_t:CDS:2, partial [Racocetra persica]
AGSSLTYPPEYIQKLMNYYDFDTNLNNFCFALAYFGQLQIVKIKLAFRTYNLV